MSLFTPPARAIAQLDDPVFIRVVLRSLVWAVLAFVALVAMIVYGAQEAVAEFVPTHGWLRWLAGGLGGVGAAVGALYLFLPVATFIATLFINPIADAVERRWYPNLPPAHPAPFEQQAWDGAALGLRVFLLQIVGLLLTLFTGIGAIFGWLIAGWAVGRGLFVALAMRRMNRPAAIAIYDSRKLMVLAQGLMIAAANLAPLVNLVAPVLGIAALVHVLHGYGRNGDTPGYDSRFR